MTQNIALHSSISSLSKVTRVTNIDLEVTTVTDNGIGYQV